MSNEKEEVKTNIPMRYFLAANAGDCGGTIWINKGVPVEDFLTKRINYLNPKSVQINSDGILVTNDPETIVSIYTRDNIKSIFIDIETGEVNELFRKNREIDLKYAKKYNIDIAKHSEELKSAISKGFYRFTLEKDLTAEMAIEENKAKSLMLKKKRLENLELEEELNRKTEERKKKGLKV